MATVIDGMARPKPLAADALEKVLAVAAAILLAVVLVALWRGRAHWHAVPWPVWAHLVTILPALALTPVMLLRPRGDRLHRLLGKVWVIAMFLTAALSFFVHMSSPHGFSVIHLLSAYVVIAAPLIWWKARQGRIAAHRGQVRGMVIGALLVAGFLRCRSGGCSALGSPAEPHVRRGSHGVAAGLFLLVWLSCVWFGSWALNPNNATRLFGALALVEQHDARIDRFETLTIDKARFGTRYYMDKAPGMTLLALPAVWAAGRWRGETSRDVAVDAVNPHFARFVKLRLALAAASVTALLTAIAAVLLFDLGTGLTGRADAGLFAALGYALGSTVWGWSTTLFSHAPVAALLTIATWAVWRGTVAPALATRRRYPLLAGAALGLAVMVEFTAALSAVAIGLFALWRARGLARGLRARLFGIALAAALAMLLPLLAYNSVAFGTPFKLGYEGVVGFQGMQQGLFGLTYPKPGALFDILFGARRGLIWVAPVLALGVVGLDQLIRTKVTRDIGLLAAGIAAIALLLNASYVYWEGGASTGARHALPAVPFLAIGLAPCWAGLRAGWARVAAALLLAGSMLLNLLIAATDIFAPERLAWPVWHNNVAKLLRGQLDTLPSDWWGWSPWRGLALYLAIALPLLWWIVRAARRADRASA